MVTQEQPSRVRLVPGQWVRLPHTGWEVYLHGKPRGEGVEVVRTFGQPDYGGWDLSPVLGRCFVRQARGTGGR